MKPGFIEIYDNIVPLEYQNYLYNLITGQVLGKPFSLFYSSALSPISNTPDYGFNNDFSNNPDYKEDILKVSYGLANYLNFNINTIFLQRVFLQTPSKKSYIPKFHIDLDHPHWVCLYYINDADGDTIFYDDNLNEIKKISPKKGRIVFFDGSIKHSAGIPTNNERIVINICFNGEFYE
jgi:hypothetical protein